MPLALIDYDGTLDWIDAAIAARSREYICVAATHTVVACGEDPELRAAVLGSSFTVPDGQPLVWALRALGNALEDRVYGPDADGARVRAGGAQRRAHVPLRRARRGRARAAGARLCARYPGLRIAGGHSPPFRELTADEEDAVVDEIDACGADVVWVGIGVPKQEKWMAHMRARLDAPVLVGVGAAFDFHAGLVAQAPPWLQRAGLEWALPADARAAPAVAALPALQPALRDRLRAAVRPAPARQRRQPRRALSLTSR